MRARLLALLALLLVGRGAAAAIVELHPYTPVQIAGTLSLGLTVHSWSNWIQLSTAGGFTVQCDFTSLTIDEERAFGIINFPGTEMYLTVPPSVPGSYTIPGYANVAANTCRSCTFKYRGSAIEGSAEITGGQGISYTFAPGTMANQLSTIVFDVCREGRGSQCCTPGCQLP